jgi:anti-anti-sigma factor
MEMVVQKVSGNQAAAVLELHGELDASNYTDAIKKVKELHADGIQFLVLDLGKLSFMSSAGLVALYSIGAVMESQDVPDVEQGWNTFRSMAKGMPGGVVQHVKLINPQPDVDRSLEISGFKAFFGVFTELDAALASFE